MLSKQPTSAQRDAAVMVNAERLLKSFDRKFQTHQNRVNKMRRELAMLSETYAFQSHDSIYNSATSIPGSNQTDVDSHVVMSGAPSISITSDESYNLTAEIPSEPSVIISQDNASTKRSIPPSTLSTTILRSQFHLFDRRDSFSTGLSVIPKIAAKITGKERFQSIGHAICKAVRSSLRSQTLHTHGSQLDLGAQATKRALEPEFDAKNALTPEILEWWRKPSKERMDAELNAMMRAIQFFPSVQKYAKRVQRELCRLGILEVFAAGRTILKQGHMPRSLYFVLAGQLDVVKLELDVKTGRNYEQVITELHVGDAFGELAMMNNVPRLASVVCKKTVALLRFDKAEFERVLKSATENAIQSKSNFLRSNSLFSDYTADELRPIVEVCNLKHFKVNEAVLAEGESSDDIYFIRKGVCRVLKTVEFIHRTLKNNRFEMAAYVHGTPLQPNEKLVPKILCIDTLHGGSYFGEAGILAVSKRQAMSEVFTQGKWKCTSSVVCSTKAEIMLMSKIDFLRMAKDRTLELMRMEGAQKNFSQDSISHSFLVQEKWNRFKRHFLRDFFLRQAEERERNRRIICPPPAYVESFF